MKKGMTLDEILKNYADFLCNNDPTSGWLTTAEAKASIIEIFKGCVPEKTNVREYDFGFNLCRKETLGNIERLR